MEYWVECLKRIKASSLFKNPSFHYSTIPAFQIEGIGKYDGNVLFDSLISDYISVMMIAFDLHTAVQVKQPRQFWGLTGIALCGISNTSVGHIFKHSSQESHLSASTCTRQISQSLTVFGMSYSNFISYPLYFHLNSKSEFRNPKQIQISIDTNSKR